MNGSLARHARQGEVPYRALRLAPPAVDCTRREDGCIVLASPHGLGEVERNFCEHLRHWALEAPQRPMLRQRVGAWRPDGPPRPWRTITYGEAYAAARRIAQALIGRGLGPERPAMILSENSIEQALLSFAGMMVGVPTVPVSPAYSLLSNDLGRIRYLAGLMTPGLVFAQEGDRYARSLRLLAELTGAELVTVERSGELPGATRFDDLLKEEDGADVDRAWGAVGPGTVAKFLLTSGSTGAPKAVPNTHGMLCANQRMLDQVVPPDPDLPPVVVDWLPWNHTFGGNLVLLTVVRRGGVLHLDGGRPQPDRFAESLENLREVSPTMMFNVPVGYAMLATEMERDEALRHSFFRDLRQLFYGGAGLPQAVWDRIQDLAVATIGERIVFTTGFGSTETGPMATFLHWIVDGPGRVGLPLPGAAVKLVPAAGRYEIRLKGPMLFPGYHRQPEKTAEAFDEEGFYRIGDAGQLVDPADPLQGIRPDGRLVEDFKLQTGSFVAVGRLRVTLLSDIPELQDAVIAGLDRPFVGVLAWPDVTACRAILGAPEATPEAICADPRIRARIAAGLQRYNGRASGASERVERLLLLVEPPSSDAGEITDKGYIFQRAVLERRAGDVAALFAEPPPPAVICAGPAVGGAA